MQLNEYTRETLRGLKGLVVLVETVGQEAEADGLDVDVLQSEVEQKLTHAGVRVLPHAEWRASEGRPWLYVAVNTMKYFITYFYSIDVQLKQEVTLSRMPRIITSSATWEMGTVGCVPPQELAGKIHESVGAYIEKFIQDFHAVNG